MAPKRRRLDKAQAPPDATSQKRTRFQVCIHVTGVLCGPGTKAMSAEVGLTNFQHTNDNNNTDNATIGSQPPLIGASPVPWTPFSSADTGPPLLQASFMPPASASTSTLVLPPLGSRPLVPSASAFSITPPTPSSLTSPLLIQNSFFPVLPAQSTPPSSQPPPSLLPTLPPLQTPATTSYGSTSTSNNNPFF